MTFTFQSRPGTRRPQGFWEVGGSTKGHFFSRSGGSRLDLPFRAWTSGKHSGGPEGFLRVGSYAGSGTGVRSSGWGGLSGFPQRQRPSGPDPLGSLGISSPRLSGPPALHRDGLPCASLRPGEGSDHQWPQTAHFKHKRPTCLMP